MTAIIQEKLAQPMKEEFEMLRNRVESLAHHCILTSDVEHMSNNFVFSGRDTKLDDVAQLKLQLFGPLLFCKFSAREMIHVQTGIQTRMNDSDRLLTRLKAQISEEEEASRNLAALEHMAWQAQREYGSARKYDQALRRESMAIHVDRNRFWVGQGHSKRCGKVQ